MVSLVIEKNTYIYFDTFGIEYIPQNVLSKVNDKSNTHNISRIKENESVTCRFYCMAFKAI